MLLKKMTQIQSSMEALLFYVGDVISIRRLSSLFNIDAREIEWVIEELNGLYETVGSGLYIVQVGEGYQMCTKPTHMEVIQSYRQKPTRNLLTQALLETLAIVAYSQPITKTQIEDIRGVRCEHAMNRLMEYGLIEEVGRLSVIGRPILFGTTKEFLRHFGFKTLEELPKIKEELIDKFREEVKEEMNYYEDEINKVQNTDEDTKQLDIW